MPDESKPKPSLFSLAGSDRIKEDSEPAPPPTLGDMKTELKKLEDELSLEIFRLEVTNGVSVSGIQRSREERGAIGVFEDRYGVIANVEFEHDRGRDRKRVKITCKVTSD